MLLEEEEEGILVSEVLAKQEDDVNGHLLDFNASSMASVTHFLWVIP